MGTQKYLPMLIKKQFDLVDKSFSMEFLCRTVVWFANSFWVLLCTYISNLFGFVIRYLFRNYENCQTKELNFGDIREEEIDTTFSGDSEFDDFGKELNFSDIREEEIDTTFSGDSVFDDFGMEEEKSEFTFRFDQFQKNGDSDKRIGETESSVLMETQSTPSTSKYEFVPKKHFSGFMEEPETIRFTIQELFMGSDDDFSIANSQNLDLGASVDKDFQNLNSEETLQQSQVDSNNKDFQQLYVKSSEAFDQEKAEDSVHSTCKEEVFEKQEQVSPTEHELYENNSNKDMVGLENSSIDYDNLSDEVLLLSENQVLTFDPKLDSSDPIDVLLVGNHIMDSNMPTDEKNQEFPEKIPIFEDSDDSFIELDPNSQNSSEFDAEKLCGTDLGMFENENEVKNESFVEMEFKDGVEKSEKPNAGNLWDSDSEDEDDFEILEEHKNLIEQIRMELRNSRAGGLPTIMEECETPRMVDDLKPLKFEEKLEHKDRMEEIHKVYKSYADKMRKLDVLNCQTMHAISFHQLKDSFPLTPLQNYSFSTIKSLIYPSFWPCKLRRVYADPTLKSITELHRDLEMVYVGQVCLSWEILHWQCEKAKELIELDSQGYRPYNQMAGEFQQFQVLVQRFIENELYQGPRVQNYAQNRCFLRALLQVPVIKEDCMKDRKERRLEGNNVISIALLRDIIEESMHLFWDFLHADKYEPNMILKALQGAHVNNQEPVDSDLKMDIKTILQKKEKRLKDIVRSGNCIVKKFQKNQEGGRLDHSVLVAQVELKLVSRVLNFSRLTRDQLVWCQMKLDKIHLVGRKIHVEPSFLPFPF